jgi:surface antigen/peptidoglycan hydrolase CwlO-like protein
LRRRLMRVLVRGAACSVLLCGTLAGGPAGAAKASNPGPNPGSPTADQLRAQRAQLEQQLAVAGGAASDAKRRLLAAQSQLNAASRRLTDSRAQLDAINARLQALTQEISAQESSLTAARGQLAPLLRLAYEQSGKDGFAAAILSAGDLGQAMDRIRQAQSVTDQVAELQARIHSDEKSLLDERTSLQAQAAQASQLEEELNQETGRLTALVAQRDLAFRELNGPARDLAARIAAIDSQLAPPITSGGCGNHFAFGYCTYYVATRRCIPWLGNAADWWGAAAAYGYTEGQVPQRGAVVVWGRSGSSPVGHVAYVEAVGPDGGVPAGSFLVSEMNHSGWDRVDYRTVRVGSPGILGFIYGKAG